MILVEKLWSVPVFKPTGLFDLSETPNHCPALSLTAGALLVQDFNGLRALNPQTGQPMWPYGAGDQGFLLGGESLSDPLFTSAGRSAPHQYGAGQHCANQYGTTGGIIAQNYWIGVVQGRLVAVNLAAEGRIEWAHDSEEWSSTGTDSVYYSSAPLAVPGGLAITLTSTTHPVREWLLCLNQDGTLQWRIEASMLNVPLPVTPMNSLALLKNGIYWNRSGHRLQLSHADSGDREWEFELTVPGGNRRSAGCVSALAVNSQLILAASDRGVWAFKTDDRSLLWRATLPTAVREFPAVDQKQVVAAGDQLMGLSATTGNVLWDIGGGSPATRGLGRGLLLGENFFWPTGEELWTVSLLNGTLRQRTEIRQLAGSKGGNLLLDGTTLVIASSDEITAFRMLLRK